MDKERIAYLKAEQREVYRVKVNDEGLLVWAKDGSLLDTSKFHEDLGAEKGGVVPISEERFKEIQEEDKEKVKRAKEEEGTSASSSDFGSSSSSSSDNEVADEVRAGSKAYGDKVSISLLACLYLPDEASADSIPYRSLNHAGRYGRTRQRLETVQKASSILRFPGTCDRSSPEKDDQQEYVRLC